MSLNIVILAAGQGTRMHTAQPKILHKVAGVPMLERVYNTAKQLKPKAIYIVTGHESEQVKEQFSHFNATWIEQEEQLGTGHAVKQVLPMVSDDDHLLVLVGDIPLIKANTLRRLTDKVNVDTLGVITASLQDPTGFGRILRNPDDEIIGIKEHRDATEGERRIKEINTGIIIAPVKKLKEWIPKLKSNNVQKEYYLTDCIAMAVEEDFPVEGAHADQIEEVLGVNDRYQLATIERIHQFHTACGYMLSGVTIADPNRFDLRGTLHVGIDIFVDINVIFEGEVSLGNNVQIGPHCLLRDCQIEDGVVIEANTVIDGAHIKANSRIGPFARIRPETQIDENVKIGNFVEIKKSTIAQGTKISHLSYIGDCEIGKNVNIGAGTITVNYDGARKHKTFIADDAFIGCDSQLVAPIRVEQGAFIAAGTTLTKNAPAGQLTLSRAEQRTVEGWKRPPQQTDK